MTKCPSCFFTTPKRLPRVDRRLLALTAQGPAIDLYDLVENKQLGVAFVCLDDARQRFGDVAYALHEAYACIIWYREFAVDPPKEMEAVFTAKLYNIDELLAQVHLAANAYENALPALIPILLKMRSRLGERLDIEEGMKVEFHSLVLMV